VQGYEKNIGNPDIAPGFPKKLSVLFFGKDEIQKSLVILYKGVY